MVAGEEAALDMDYKGLKKLLLSHFQGERTTYVRKLKNLKLGSDLVKFNTDFALLAASATPLLGKWGVKEQYLDVVEARVGPAIRLKQDESLQKIMAAALDLAAAKKAAPSTSATVSGQSRP